MKVLKYLVITLAVLAALFLMLGVLKPSVSYGHEITVNKPVEEAWAVFQDDSKYDQWLMGFKSIEPLSGEKGKVGSTYKVVVEPGEGQPPFEMIETIESIKEFDHITLRFDSDMMVFNQTTSLKSSGDQTTLKTDSVVKGKGIFMRSMFAAMDIFTGSFQAGEEKNIENLKKVIESNTTDYYPAPEPVADDMPGEQDSE